MDNQIVIQILLVLGIVAIGAGLLKGRGGQRRLAIQRLGIGAFVLFSVVAILAPGLITNAARIVGVGRGTDLVLYILVIAFLASLATSFKKQSSSSDRFAELVREVALLEYSISAPSHRENNAGEQP